MIADVVTVVLIIGGLAFFTAGTVGLIRFPDPVTRLRALVKADNFGIGLILLGLMAQADSVAVVGKLLLIWFLAMFATATNEALLASRARSRGDGA